MAQGTLMWFLCAALAIVAALSLAAALQARRQRRLAARFGPEYERVIDLTDSTREAEARLKSRIDRRERLHISPLTAEEASLFARRWHAVQAEFVDSPASAVGDAQALVDEVMRSRGYPVHNFESAADLVSVDHPHVTEHYRAAHAVYLACREEHVTTEQLRQALVHYRVLFAELLELDTTRP